MLRDAPHCALMQRNSGKKEIVVAGSSLPGSERTTEIFSVTDNRWRRGPPLPLAIIYGVSIQLMNSLIILGGKHIGAKNMETLDTIFVYDYEEDLWRKKDKKMSTPRISFVAIALPEFLHCNNNL